MRLDAQDRILSVSFERDPKEHVEIMVSAGRRMARPRRRLPAIITLLGSVIIGVAVGLSTEAYRSLVLEPLLGSESVAPLNVVVLQLLPLGIMFFALCFIFGRRSTRLRRQALMDRLGSGRFFDVDIFKDGIRTSSELLTIMLGWRGVSDIILSKDRVEFESDTFVCYIPDRAFKSRAEFEAAVRQTRQLWAEAKDRATPEAATASTGQISKK